MSNPAPTSTHGVLVDGDLVIKRYASAERGEPQREWAALRLLALHSPGLAPRPLDLAGPPWVLQMSRVTGAHRPREQALTAGELARLGAAFQRLWSVPVDVEPPLPPRIMAAPATAHLVSELLRVVDLPREPASRTALEAFRSWFFDAGEKALAQPCRSQVFSRGDQNLDNVLWDGNEVRLVDFEDAGLSCRSYDLADLAEHVSTRGTPDHMWLAFADAHRDNCEDMFEASRRVLAGWWLLALLPGGVGHHRNPAGSDVRQAERLMRLLESA